MKLESRWKILMLQKCGLIVLLKDGKSFFALQPIVLVGLTNKRIDCFV